MTNYIKTIIIIVLFISSAKTNAQTFQWAKDVKSIGYDEAYDLVVDAEGNTYAAGQVEFDADFGDNVILTSAGIHDIWLAKYNPAGKLVWAKRAGGRGGDKIQSITLDGLGHIFCVGEFEDSSYWDGIMKYTNGPEGVNNMFIAKYDTSGPVIWVRNIGVAGPLQTRGYGVACDAQGNVYACGGTKGDTYYNNTFLFSTAGDYDGTVIKFDPNGVFCWARRIGGIDSDKAYGIVSDNNGSIYVTGYFAGNISFSSSNITLNGRGHTDIFLAKYDTAGSLQWAKMAGDTGFDRGWDVSINVNGQIIITGEFQTGYFGTHLAHSRGNEDMFVAAYNSSGDNLWVTAGGGPEDDIGRGVSHDASGNIFVIGDYASTGIFPPATITSNGFADIFVASYTSDGSTLNWIRSTGGLLNDRGRGVGTDPAGNISVCGEFNDSIIFDATHLVGDTNLDIFVAKIIQGVFCSTQASASAQNSCNGMCNGIATATSTGQGQLIYNWSTSPPQNGAVATGLCAGSYSVTVTDAVGCSSTAFVTLTDPPLLQPSTISTDPSCTSACNGSAIADATGQGPFTFHWLTSPPQSGSSATNLCAGTFTVIATDAAGCTASVVAVVTDPPLLQPSTAVTNSNCAGSCDGTATASATGNGPFTFHWQTSPPQSGPVANGLCQGTFTVITTDAAGCTSTAAATLTDPQPLQLSATITNASCIGCSDGAVNLNVAGGTTGYQYLWSDGNTTQDLQHKRAGTYTVCVTDLNNCNLCDTFTVMEPGSGIATLNSSSEYSVFPNPFRTSTTIKLKNVSAERTLITLYTTTGQVVFQTDFRGNEFILSGDNLSSGVYFLKIYNLSSDELRMIQLIVED